MVYIVDHGFEATFVGVAVDRHGHMVFMELHAMSRQTRNGLKVFVKPATYKVNTVVLGIDLEFEM